MAPRDRIHIIVPSTGLAERFTPHLRNIPRRSEPILTDRADHGTALGLALRSAEAEGRERRAQRTVRVEGAIDGIYLVFESFPGLNLALESLDPRVGKRHPELRAVQEVAVDGKVVERVTVFVPDGTLGYFLQRLEQYVGAAADGKTRHAALVDRIQTIELASLQELWTDPRSKFPGEGERVWWEVWLRRRDGSEKERFHDFAAKAHLRTGRLALGFEDRTVLVVEATAAELVGALEVTWALDIACP